MPDAVTPAAPAAPSPSPAPAAVAAPVAPTPAPAPTPTDWTTGFNDETKGYVQNKGFKGAQDVLDSYRNFEKLHGVPQERILKLPENLDSPEGRAVFERLGAPKEAKEYKIEIPKEHGDEKLAEGLREVAFKSGMTHKQVENLVGWWNERSDGAIKAQTEQHQAMLTAADQNLKSKWGAAYEQNKNIADAGAMKLGMDEKAIRALGNSLGPDKALELLYSLGRATGEASFVSGQATGGSIMAPEQAKSKIKELMKDPTFQKRFTMGDSDARQQWDKLNKQAAGVRP